MPINASEVPRRIHMPVLVTLISLIILMPVRGPLVVWQIVAPCIRSPTHEVP